MTHSNIPIRYTDPSQETGDLANVAAEIARILTPSEEILYVALQNATALSIHKDSVVATNNRVIFYNAHLLGRVSFEDVHWQDVHDAELRQGTFSSEFSVTTTDGRTLVMSNLDKDQAKRLYGICQQQEQEWREKRRIREMEEMRARAGGIQLTDLGPRGATAEDPVERLAKAKAMLEKGLISEAEYETLKAKILSAM